MTAAPPSRTVPAGESGQPQLPLDNRIKDLRARSQNQPAAAFELADTLSLHPYLSHADEIKSLYEFAARAGIPEAQAAIAELALSNTHDSAGPESAICIWRDLAQGGFAQAMLQYGYCLRHAIGTKAAPEAGVTQYLTAAAQGNTTAFALLALLFESGDGASYHPATAKAWRELAALRRFPATPRVADGSAISDLAEAIKTNIQGLGPRIAALDIGPEDPRFASQFAAEVTQHFSLLGRPEVSLDETERRAANQTPPEPRTPETPAQRGHLSWTPRIFTLRSCVSAESCIHILAAWPGEQTTGDAPLPLSAMTPAAHDALAAVSQTVHLPPSHFEPLVMVKLDQELRPQHWQLSQPARLAKSGHGDHSGRRLITAWVVLASTDKQIEFQLAPDGRSEMLAPGDLLCSYEVTPDGQPSGDGVRNIRCAGDAWLLRMHACEREVWPDQGTAAP